MVIPKYHLKWSLNRHIRNILHKTKIRTFFDSNEEESIRLCDVHKIIKQEFTQELTKKEINRQGYGRYIQ